MRKHSLKKRNNFPNFILVDEMLYQRFSEFCKTFNYLPITGAHCDSFLTTTNPKITELPDTFSNFILIDNQTGRIIR